MSSVADSLPEPGGEEFDEMQRLFANAERFASTVREQLEELTASRDRAVAAAQREAEDFIEEATLEAESVLTEADQAAQATMEQAHGTAHEITDAARRDTEQLVATNAQYRTALEGALRALDDLPQVPALPTAAPEPEPVKNPESAMDQPQEAPQTILTSIPTT